MNASRTRRNALQTGYVEGTSLNIPKIDAEMILLYISSHASFYASEYRFKRTMSSYKSTYSSDAVGWVQVSTTDVEVTVKMAITAQTKPATSYPVTVKIDLENEEILESKCEGCVASVGCCKHAMTALF